MPRRPQRSPAAAFRLAKGRGALDLAIGEALDLLFTGGGMEKLGWSRQVDFTREVLALPPRTMYAFLDLAREVKDLPRLRLAIVRGDVSPLKARAIAPAKRVGYGAVARVPFGVRVEVLGRGRTL